MASSRHISEPGGLGLREKINRNPTLAMALAAGFVLVAAGFGVWAILPSRGAGPDSLQYSDAAFYTTDDGATYFRDSGSLYSPFTKDGKVAVRAHVFTCDRGKTRFVGYLERYRPEAKKQLEALQKTPANMENTMTRSGLMMSGVEVKKPGQPGAKWVSPSMGTAYADATNVTCPDGTGAELEVVMP